MARPPLLPVTALTLLVACNGGGSGGSFAALRITSMVPPPGSIVAPDSSIAITFDREPDLATLTAEAFTVSDAAGPLPGTLTYDNVGRTWTWTPEDELPRGAPLVAVVEGTVLGAEGAPRQRSTWTLAVRRGTPGSPQLVLADAAITSGLHVARFGRDRARLAAGGNAWELGPSGPDAGEPTQIESIAQWHVDAGGIPTALGFLPPGLQQMVGVARRAPAGGWGMIHILSHPTYQFTDLRMVGNERGDVLVHLTYGQPPAPWREHRLHWASASAPTAWYEPAAELLQGDERMVAALDASGRFATLRNDGDYIVVQRHDAALGPVATYPVGQDPFAQAETLVASADGTLRAVWHAPGVARQAFAPPGQVFAAPTDVPVGIPTGCAWRSAATGAVVGWQDSLMVRSEVGATAWTQFPLAHAPLAVAMSPRGEAAWLEFELPNRLLLLRWRAGETPVAPQLVATIASAAAAFRSGALAIDAAGRVTIVFAPDVPGDLVAITVE